MKMQHVKANNRILYFDALECLAIFLVISVHSCWLNGNVLAGISMSLYPLAVPVFFMVHGASLLGKDFSAPKHLKRTGKVFFQLLVWGIIYLILSMIFGFTEEKVTLGYVYRYFCQGGMLNARLGGPLWFIYALLTVYLLYPILCSLDKKQYLYIAVVAFVFGILSKEIEVWGRVFGEHFLGTGVSLNNTLGKLSPFGEYGNCLFYFVSGYLLHEKLTEESEQHSREILVGSVLLFLAGITLMMLERKVEFGSFAYNWKPLAEQYRRAGSACMAFGVFALFSQIPFQPDHCKTIVKISMHTIDIYYIHDILAKLAYGYLFQQKYAGVLQNYLRAALILVLSYWIGQGIRRIPIVKKIL